MRQRALHRLFWTLLAIPYFKPAIFAEVEALTPLETLFNYWRVAAAGALCVLYLIQAIRTRRVSLVMAGLAVYECAIVLSTVVQSNNWFYALNCAATMASFCMLLELSLADDPLLTLDAVVFPLTFQLTLNLILLIVFPYGITHGGYFGNSFNYMAIDNQLAAFILPWIVCCCLRATLRTGDLDFLAYYSVWLGLVTELLVWSATGMVAVFVLAVFVLFFFMRRGEALFNFDTAMLGAFGMFFGINLFRLQQVLALLVEGVLRKGLSFTGRTELWDTAIEMFLASPWIGCGLGVRGKVYRLRKGRYYPAHSIFLEILIQGGVLAMGGFLLMLAAAGKKLMEHWRQPCACLLSAGLLAYGVVGSMESYIDNNAVLLFGLIVLSAHVDLLVRARRLSEEAEKPEKPEKPEQRLVNGEA